MPNKIRAFFIFEMLGRPAEHLKESLNKLIDQLGKQKGIEIVKKEVHEPKKLDEKDKNGKVITGENLFTSFCEIEILANNLNLIFAIIFNMLPSHVEIIEPEEYRFKNFELSSLLTDLTVKLHKYDEIAKVLMFERKNLLDKLSETEERVTELEKEIKEKK